MSLFLLVLYHFIMNLNSIAVGLYLAFTLSNSFTGESSPSYNYILSLIMVSSVVTSFLGKYLSNKIVRISYFFLFLTLYHAVYGNQSTCA